MSAAYNDYKDGLFVRTYSGLNEVPTDIPREAREVYTGGNNITALKSYSFSNLSQCIELDLSLNIIAQIDPGAFFGLQKLEQLGLNRNMLTEITGDTWQGIQTLRGLFLMGNCFEEVNKGMWKNLPELEELWLTSNQISVVKPYGFANLPNLLFLDLFDNKLTTLDQNVLPPEIFLLNGDDHLFSLHLNLGENSLQCDSRMCWLRDAEKLGSINLTMIPQCDDDSSSNHVAWSDLEC